MKRRFSYPLVYCISEGDLTAANYHQKKKLITDRVRRAAGRGVDLYQIREKDLSGRLLFDLASAAVEAAHGSETRILINGRADIALAASADGVHLPANGVPVRELRGCVPEDFLIGASTHSIAEAEAARAAGADLVTFGPVFASPGKGEPTGAEKLREVANALGTFPVIALGGIDEHNLALVMEHGASGYAAIRYLNQLLDH